jgi:Nucleoside 2-deoxyribosyltransferase like
MIFKPPQNIALRDRNKKSIFLAGTIDLGFSENWQEQLGEWFLSKNYNVFNPRRNDWDSSWIQTYENPQFSQQVKWELNALDKADWIVMYLMSQSKSPISLLELGLHANSKKLLVVCPDGFYRKGNVEVVCEMYDIPLFNTIDDLKLVKYL